MNKKLISHKLSKTSKTLEVVNPANGKIIAKLPNLGAKETAAAINRAHNALESWQSKTAWERASALHKWSDLILKNKDDIAEILTAELGKIPEESLAEIDYAASFIPWAAEEAKRVYGEIIPMPNQTRGMVIKQPIGVVAAITPWNFPAAMITRKVAPALAAGCTVVCKPSEETPLTAIALHNLALEAGIPADVFALIIGDPEPIGAELTANPKVKALSFTGSTEVGKYLYAACAKTVKKITLELGGNAPFIVFDDANLEKAVINAVKSRFRNAGQACTCTNRIYIQERIYDEFSKAFTAKVKSLKIAPLINSTAIKKVDALVKNSGAKILIGGKYKNNFYEPTVLDNVTPTMEIYHAEIFGPVATLIKFRTEAEVIKAANDTNYGLGAFLFTEDLNRGLKVAEKLNFGMVGLNDINIAAAHSPFGGFNESGIGREGSHYGIDEFLEVKFINISL